MSGFLVTYGPNAHIWCTTCNGDTPLLPHIDGTVRAEDIRRAKRIHVCGLGAWDLDGNPQPDAMTAGAGS